MERRQAEEERRAETASHVGEEGSPFDAEEPEVDLVALSDKSRKLLNTAILFYGFFGLWLLWSDLFPALRILDQVTLWHHTVTVDGEAQVLPVTLASVGLALFYAVITVILAKQLPAVLEIILLKFSEMSAGSRYTVTTLTNYVIVTAGAVLVFQTIGTDWSQLQWLVAALGVGIGFGLQEIVANFISGIIVLFERPIRIGDVVTVGDTDGVVTTDPQPCDHHPQLGRQGAAGAEQGVHHRSPAQLVPVGPNDAGHPLGRHRLRLQTCARPCACWKRPPGRTRTYWTIRLLR